jgi:glucose/arabinose dehydrogenase
MTRLHGAFACGLLSIGLGVHPVHSAVLTPTGFTDELLVPGLDQPNGMAFLPDGRLLFTEQRTGRVRMVVNGHLASEDPVLTVPELENSGYEQGLQGVAVDPAWPTRPFVYLYYNRLGQACRLVRYTASGDLSTAVGEHLSFADPLLLLDDIPDDDPNHNSGCLRFGPDGFLYVSIGDDEDRCAAQDTTVLKGKILRLDVTRLGAAGGGPVALDLLTPASHPLQSADSVAKLVWAYGMRNPWRFHADPLSPRLYGVDVGESDYEEVNEISGGEDLGWPYFEGPKAFDPGCAFAGHLPYTPPIYAFARPATNTAFVSGGIYRRIAGRSANWPLEYEGQVFYAEYYSGVLRRLRRTGATWAPAPAAPGQPDADDWATGLVSAVDFLVGPDGSLWWMSQFDDTFSAQSGAVHRIRWIASPDTDTTIADAPVRLFASPNPFAVATTFSLRLGSARRVTITLHDVTGRRVRRLFDGLAASEAAIVWDGSDDRGRAVPPGVYLARLTGAGIETGTRILRLR